MDLVVFEIKKVCDHCFKVNLTFIMNTNKIIAVHASDNIVRLKMNYTNKKKTDCDKYRNSIYCAFIIIYGELYIQSNLFCNIVIHSLQIYVDFAHSSLFFQIIIQTTIIFK